MTTVDFASFKAIVLADPSCSYDPTIVDFLSNTKNTWGPAVTGNMVLIGKSYATSLAFEDADITRH